MVVRWPANEAEFRERAATKAECLEKISQCPCRRVPAYSAPMALQRGQISVFGKDESTLSRDPDYRLGLHYYSESLDILHIKRDCVLQLIVAHILGPTVTS
jgi:hypothetical protein